MESTGGSTARWDASVLLSVLFRGFHPDVPDEGSRFSILAAGAFVSCKLYYISPRRSKAIASNATAINYAPGTALPYRNTKQEYTELCIRTFRMQDISISLIR